MSTYRLITRLAVVSALNNYLQRPYPTLAGRRVFDSKIEPVEDIAKDTAFPCVVVYTDYDKDHWSKATMAHKKRLLSVTLEMLIVQAKKGAKPNSYKLDCPYTDSEIEISLDILEWQVARALKMPNAATTCFNYIASDFVNITSRRGATVAGGQRLAARQITLEINAVRDNEIGIIPQPVDAFLTELGMHSDYGRVVEDIRQMMLMNADDTPAENIMKIFGYTESMTRLLAAVQDPSAVLPPDIVWEGLP